MKTLAMKIIQPLRRMYYNEQTYLGRQRLVLLLLCYIPVTLLGIIAISIGVSGPQDSFFDYTHSAFLLVAAVLLALLFTHRINVSVCLTAFTILGEATVSVEMIFSALHPTEYYLMLIVGDTVLLAMNTMVAVAASLKWDTMALGAMTIAAYVACVVITGNAELKSFLVVFIISFSLVSLVGLWVSIGTYHLDRENTRLRKEEAELLGLLRLKKNEIQAFIGLASKESSNDGTRILLDRLDKKSRHRLLSNVEEYLKVRDTDMKVIESAFPELTPSERDICRLVLQGKKLGDICMILNKNESNINSQRSNMRKKLGLQPSDNLQEQLQRRIDKARTR